MAKNDLRLKALTIGYNTLYDGAVEEVRGIIEASGRQLCTPPNIRATLMHNIYGRVGVVAQTSATKSCIFRY
jgi:hypothetical protein